MTIPSLTPSLTDDVLRFLQVARATPSVTHVDALLAAYTAHVPWESAFRISKRAITNRTDHCARWPDEFWRDAMTLGGGGTCFESNYAMLSLLEALGYDGYLTINDMPPRERCHSAIVLQWNDTEWLVDVGLPLYTALPIPRGHVEERVSPFHRYSVHRRAEQLFAIERDQHVQSHCFTLIHRAVADEVYRQAMIDDYGEHGLFLDRVIVTKVINGRQWRFNSLERPFRLEMFERGQRTEHVIEQATEHDVGQNLERYVARIVGQHFGMNVTVLERALEAVSAK